MDNYKLLSNMSVVTLAQNLPGPLAAKRLGELGATVIKIEPPAGDPFQQYCLEWYRDMKVGQQCLPIDLKSAKGQTKACGIIIWRRSFINSPTTCWIEAAEFGLGNAS